MTNWRVRVDEALPSVTGDRRRDDEIRDELTQHCVEREQELIEEGLAPAQAAATTLAELRETARRRSRIALAVQHPHESGRAVRVREIAGRAVTATSHAVRACRRAPGATATIVVTLALAIGAATLAFAVLRGVVLRPLPLPAPEQLVYVWETSPTGNARNVVAAGNYLDWRDRAKSFHALAAAQGPYDVVLTGSGDPQPVQVTSVTPSITDVVGLPPAVGRFFAAADDATAGPAVALVSFAFWRTRLGGDRAAVGKPITLDGVPTAVIGVLPPEAVALLGPGDIYVPTRLTAESRAARRSHIYVVLGRVRAGVSTAQASAEMQSIAGVMAREHPQDLTNWGTHVVSAHADAVRRVRPVLVVIFGVVVVVVLVASANLANLQLARATRRRAEMSLRTALGASRGRLTAMVLAESASLALTGGLLGLALAAAWLRPLLAAVPITIPLASSIAVDGAVVAFAGALVLLCSIVIGVVPAVQAGRAGAAPIATGTRVTAGPHRTRHMLIAAQVALSLVLLVSAALLVQSFARVLAVDHGFDPRGLLAVRLDLPRGAYPDGPAQIAFYDRAIARLAAVPGVIAAAGTTGQPAAADVTTYSFSIENRPSKNPSGREHPVPLQAITADYFATMRIPLRAGRTFTAEDRAGRPSVLVINEALARRHWPAGDALGKRIAFRQGQSAWLEIVGIVGDTREAGLDQPAPPQLYVPYAQKPDNWRWLSWHTALLRTTGDGAALVPSIRAAITDLDPSLPLLEVSTVDAWYAQQGALRRFAMYLLSGFAALALALGAIGIYSVLSFSVAERRREFGVRLALGASHSRLTATVVRAVVWFATAGLALGAGLAVAVTRFLSALLYEIDPADPVTFAAVAAGLALVVVIAAWLPTRRALRVNPALTLTDR
jgi:putative ABC transport system permease protein